MRYFYNRKPTAEASCDLSIFWLRKLGMLSSGQTIDGTSWTNSMTGKTTTVSFLIDVTNEPFMILMYTLTDRDGNKTKCDQKVWLTTTPCNFGGKRYWFLCPICYYRVGVLYLPRGDVRFACRHCNDITYDSRNRCIVGEYGHTSRQIDKLRSQTKRRTWRDRPTKKVRRLKALERKMEVLSRPVMMRIEKFRASLIK